jgi:hypothetical protein
MLFVILPVHVFAQSSNASLGGTVTDATGALIPGVTVNATNAGTGIVSTLLTNEEGAYQFPALQPGAYTVSAALPGFQTYTYSGVTLGISQQVRLNFTLQLSSVAQQVEVTVAADTLIATTSASVGIVLPEYKVRDLPLQNRDVIDLVQNAPGVRDSNFAGAPTGFTMTTRDGIPVNQGRYNAGAFTQTFISPDLIDEVRVIVSPADAETGRGSGQVQLATRSGTNEFHGSLFWTNRNSVWDANTFSNNFNNIGKDTLNRNQYGGRLGGPIIRNKTFFFFLYEGQRVVQKAVVAPIVLTQTAKDGFFRFFPGAQNAGAASTASPPTVDLAGNPVQPSTATGPLQTVTVFGRDPNRPGPDQSGLIRKILDAMPLPNDFLAAGGVDGLNTARHRWTRRREGTDTLSGGSEGDNTNRDQYNLRIDHLVNANHKLSLSATREHGFADLSLSEWPGGFNGLIDHHPQVYTGSFVSTLSRNLVNEFRFGHRRGKLEALQAFDHPETGEQARQFMGLSNGIPFTIEGTLFGQSSMVFVDNGSIGNQTPLWTIGDNISWVKGKHAFKGGVEMRRQRGNAWNSDEIVPAVHLGPSPWAGPLGPAPFGFGPFTVQREYYNPGAGISVVGISTNAPDFTGINATDAERARALLTDLSGSIANISQAFSLRPDPTDIVWLDYSQYYQKYRDFRQSEFSWFFKDDWKVRPNLTLNLGVRWEWYGVPYEGNGMMAAPVGGSDGLFGLTGSGFEDWYKPGERGELTMVEFVGKNSPQPDKQLYQNDGNNFGPAIGVSWSLPWWGEGKTVVRAGYGVAYQGRFAGGGGLGVDINVGLAPSTNQFARHPTTLVSELDLRNIVLSIPERNPPGALPIVPVTERSQGFTVYDSRMVTPYIQNFNIEVQREIAPNLTMEVRYIGSKGTKLESNLFLNNPIVEENGILNAFNITATGGDAALFNQLLSGINVPGAGVVNGTTLTGSQALRLNTSTRAFLANGNVQGLADFLNQNSSFTGQVGGIMRQNGFPENFIVTNPQFGSRQFGGAAIVTNLGNSTYHSLQVAVTKRLSQGFTNQTTYTWSRTLGTTIVDPRNRSRKTLQTFHRTHDIRSNGTFELPMGPERRFFSDAPGWLSRMIERWQLGAIFNWSSGAPLSLTAGTNPFQVLPNSTNYANLVGDFPKSSGNVTISNTPGRIEYFQGLQRVPDPLRATITTSQNLRAGNTQFAIADSQGNLLLTNPAAGQIGSVGQNWIEGPGQIRMDANLIKRMTVTEATELELRLDAINVLNTPQFGNPTVDINSPSFGLIALPTQGNRTFSFGARLNF